MSDMSDFRLSGSSEFPNDNPSLHEGAVWVCFATCGPLRPVVRPRAGRASTPPAAGTRSDIGSLSNSGVAPCDDTTATAASDASPLPPLELELTPPLVAHLVGHDAIELELTPAEASTAAILAATEGADAECEASREAAWSTPESGTLEPESTPTLAEILPPERHELDGDVAPTSGGCALSADLEPDETAALEPRFSETRARMDAADSPAANDASPETPVAPAAEDAPADLDARHIEPPVPVAMHVPVEVECAPAVAADTASVDVELGADSERATILPPPSDDAASRTLTLATIRVSGKSVAPEPAASLEMHVDGATSAASAEEGTACAEQDPFGAFVGALVGVALAAGATRTAAVLPGFLEGMSQDGTGFSDSVRTSLVASGVASEQDGGLSPSAAFDTTATAWRRVLRNESNDFAACGTITLDVWAADLLKAFGVGIDGRVDVRRELRRRGVAAFGMILAA